MESFSGRGALPPPGIDRGLPLQKELADGNKDIAARLQRASRMAGSASAVCRPLLWQRMMLPGCTRLVTRSAISLAERSFQSRLSTSHWMTVYPSSSAVRIRRSSYSPKGARKSFTSLPVTAAIAADESRSSARMRSSAMPAMCECVALWVPISCPAPSILRT